VNVSVLDASGRMLALRRSSATHDTNNVWTLGGCETLRRGSDAGGQRDLPLELDELARKCLRKELGLGEDDYGPVSISCVGVNFWSPRPGAVWSDPSWPGANVRVHAQVRSHLECHEIWDRVRTGPDVFEHDRYAAIDSTPDAMVNIINSVLTGQPDSHGRVWVQFAALAAQELYRNRANRALVNSRDRRDEETRAG
jgi:hypothetical protein